MINIHRDVCDWRIRTWTVVEELIRVENENGLSFGDYTLNAKKKVSDFEFHGDMYKVKTYRDITKLEKNELFVYESVPGTSVFDFEETDVRTEFEVEGFEDTQITLELEAEQEYEVFVDDVNIGRMTTNLGGKLVLSVELGSTQKHVKIVKV
ncbi:MAG: endosialidase [Coprococcus sp.]